MLLSYFIPVFADEAYYYIWSLHPQLSYFDHPPMVSWFIWLAHTFLPAGNPISIRFLFILAGCIVLLIWHQILKEKNFNNDTIFIFLIFLLLNPLLGVGSIAATPDAPLTLFWSLSYYSFLKVLTGRSLAWYALLGASLGLGFCSKYHIVLFVLSGLIYILISKTYRQLNLFGVFLTILFGAILSLPVLIWNYQNHWVSFAFQLNHGFGEDSFSWAWPIGYLGAQFLIINPIIAFSLFQKTSSGSDRAFSITQLVFFFTSSFKSVVEGNWPITSHFHSIAHFCQISTKKMVKFALFYSFLFYILFYIFFQTEASIPVKKNMINSSQISELLPLIDTYKPLYGASYQIASLLTWKSQVLIPKLTGLSRHDFFDSLPESTPDTSVFYVLKYSYSEWPHQYQIFKKIKLESFDNLGIELYQFSYE